jgi:hypothetical protein
VSAFRAYSREVGVATETLLTNEERESDDGARALDYAPESEVSNAWLLW